MVRQLPCDGRVRLAGPIPITEYRFIMICDNGAVTGEALGIRLGGIRVLSERAPTQEALPVANTPHPPGPVYQVTSEYFFLLLGTMEWAITSRLVGPEPAGTYRSNSPWTTLGR